MAGRALSPHLRVLAAADVAGGDLQHLEEALGVGVVVGAKRLHRGIVCMCALIDRGAA